MPAPAPSLQHSNTVRGPAGDTRLGDVIDGVAARLKMLETDGPCVVTGRSPVDLVAAAGWLAATRKDGMIVPSERLTSEQRTRLTGCGYSLVDLDTGTVTPPASCLAPQAGRVSILTSGTTGEPKIITHTWESLFTMDRVKSSRAANWLMTYQAGTYAWWQMVTMVLFLPGQSVTVSAERTPAALMEAALAHEVTAISATPTFWRMVMLQFTAEDLRRFAPRQITLGGEAVDQPLLDRLRALFPEAALTHIYASSEAGAAVVVRDAREGFPAAWLTAEADAGTAADTPQVRIRDGILWIRSPYAADSGWLCSGDLCEVRGDRVVILGREQGGFINVGGAKVPAHEVERAIGSHPAVLWCRVKGRKAPLLGELVTADVVFHSAADRMTEEDLARHCASQLAEHMIPRFWNVLETIPATDNLKTRLT